MLIWMCSNELQLSSLESALPSRRRYPWRQNCTKKSNSSWMANLGKSFEVASRTILCIFFKIYSNVPILLFDRWPLAQLETKKARPVPLMIASGCLSVQWLNTGSIECPDVSREGQWWKCFGMGYLEVCELPKICTICSSNSEEGATKATHISRLYSPRLWSSQMVGLYRSSIPLQLPSFKDRILWKTSHLQKSESQRSTTEVGAQSSPKLRSTPHWNRKSIRARGSAECWKNESLGEFSYNASRCFLMFPGTSAKRHMLSGTSNSEPLVRLLCTCREFSPRLLLGCH